LGERLFNQGLPAKPLKLTKPLIVAENFFSLMGYLSGINGEN
jgi:hypothetical protein